MNITGYSLAGIWQEYGRMQEYTTTPHFNLRNKANALLFNQTQSGGKKNIQHHLRPQINGPNCLILCCHEHTDLKTNHPVSCGFSNTTLRRQDGLFPQMVDSAEIIGLKPVFWMLFRSHFCSFLAH